MNAKFRENRNSISIVFFSIKEHSREITERPLPNIQNMCILFLHLLAP